MHTSKLPPNPKIRIIAILHQFRDKAARFYLAESFDAYALLHLAEVRFSGDFVAVAAGVSQEAASPEPFHQVLAVGYLLQLTQKERSEVALRAVLCGSPRAFLV